MPAGIQVFNDEGLLQISESYRNYLFDRKVVIVGQLRDDFAQRYYGYYYALTTNADDCVAFRGVGDCPVALFSTSISGNTATHTFCTTRAYTGTPQATFYVFSINKAPPPISFGLEVYDEQSRLAFSSNDYYMKPVATRSSENYRSLMDINDQSGGSYGVIGSASDQVAIMQSGPCGGYFTSIISDGGSGPWFVDEDVFSCSFSNRGSQFIISEDRVGGEVFGPISARLRI